MSGECSTAREFQSESMKSHSDGGWEGSHVQMFSLEKDLVLCVHVSVCTHIYCDVHLRCTSQTFYEAKDDPEFYGVVVGCMHVCGGQGGETLGVVILIQALSAFFFFLKMWSQTDLGPVSLSP